MSCGTENTCHDGHMPHSEMPIPQEFGYDSSRVHDCIRQEFDCGGEQEVIRHQHIVKHRRDIINEYDVVHEYDINHYDIVRHRDVVRTNDFTSHQPNYCGCNDVCACNRPTMNDRNLRMRRRFW